jgi:GH25 family lysozyme M1 (1,4-beta-N-acetylmuramidase)
MGPLAGCTTGGPTLPAEPAVPPYVSPYTWENLARDGEHEGRYSYYKDGERVSRTGIDVSSHQREIDWQAVAADGIEFAIIRVGNRGATEGQISLDEQFHANVEGARQAGIPFGVYFFSQAISAAEAVEEAEFTLAALDGTELAYPVVYDLEPVMVSGLEGRANRLSREQASANATAFCERIQLAGYTTMLYGNKKDIALYEPNLLESNQVWFAEYGVPVPTGQFDFIMWQYSNTTRVAGITTNVDLDIHFLEP